MNGIMKWGLISAMGAVCYSCGSDDLYDPEKADELKLAKYEKAFVAKYGTIAPDQDWGFGSAEVAAKAVTRSESVHGNGVADYIAREDLPPAITDAEKSAEGDVVKAFKENTGITIESLNWTDFTVQHVYAGNHSYSYKDNNNATQTISNASGHMDYLLCDGLHIDSFNAAGFSRNESITYDGESVPQTFIFMRDSKTVFTYHNSYDGNTYNKYIVKKINGAYYLGFDFSVDKGDAGAMEGDGIYDDWIIKVTPAKFKGTRRIMAEDLALTTGDFDFNDVVFDAAKVGNEYVITLRAAGGMLPLYIEDKEVHELFGVSATTMVNTQPGKHDEKAPVMFRLKDKSYTNLHDIKITVKGAERAIELVSNIGKAPGKLCGPTTYEQNGETKELEWSDETQGIDNVYTNFRTNVTTQGKNWWE